jgi:hypothetical protein
VAQTAQAALTMTPDHMKHYATSLRQAAGSIKKIRKFATGAKVALALEKLATASEGAGTTLTKTVQTMNPNELIASIRKAAS